MTTPPVITPLSRAPRAPRVDVTAAAFATLGGAALAGLPWSRTGRTLFEGGPTALAQLGAQPLLLLVGAALAAPLVGALFLRRRAGGLAAVGGGLAAVLLVVLQLALTGRAFDAGALAVLAVGVTLAGLGLVRAGLVRGDPFVGLAIAWSAAAVAAFILYPLLSILRNAFGESGFTLAHYAEVLSSPSFFQLESPDTPWSERTAALAALGVGAGLGLGVGAWRRAGPAGLLRHALAGAALLGVGTALALGFGALRNSVLLCLSVAASSTSLGFAFALLGSRSRRPIAPYVALPLVAGGAFLGAFLGTSVLGRLLPPAAWATLGGALGAAVAWIAWRRRWNVTRLMGAFSVLPIITPPFVIGFALIFLLGRQGVITNGVLGLDTDAFLGPFAVFVAQTLAYTPIAYLVLVGVVNALDPSVEEAAQTLRASRWTVLRTVVWPLLRPGLANAFLLGMIESLSDFGNPFILGGSYLSTEVFLAIEFSPESAAVLGSVLLAMTLSVFVLQQRWIGRSSFVTVTGKPSGGRLSPLPVNLERALLVVFVAWTSFVVLVYGSMLYGALVKLWGFDPTFTLEHIAGLREGPFAVFLNSLRLAALSAPLATVVGFVVAFLVTRVRFRGRALLEGASLLSFALPGTVMGIAYVLAFNGGPLFLTGTATVIALAFVFRNMPVSIRSSVAALKQIDPSLEEASATLRAGTGTTLWRVVLPLVSTAVLSGIVFAFVRAVTAVSQVIFLITPENKLVTGEILGMVERGQLGAAAAMCAVLVLTLGAVIALLALATRLLGGRREVRP